MKLAVRNLLRRPRRTFLLSLLGIISTLLIFFTEAIFSGMSEGLSTSYAGSLTGDIAVAEEASNTTSIFGNDLPMVGEYFMAPPIAFYDELAEFLETRDDIHSWSPVVSSAAELGIGDYEEEMQIFGIKAATYFQTCPNIFTENVDLSLLEPGNKGISLPLSMKSKIEEDNPNFSPGDEILVTFAISGIFNIEKGVFAGYHDYVNQDSPFDKIALADPLIPRQLLNFSVSAEEEQSFDEIIEDDMDFLDALFEESSDIVVAAEDSDLLDDIADILLDTDESDIVREAQSDVWNFVLIRGKKNYSPLMRDLEDFNRDNTLYLKIMDWKQAAGLPSQSAFSIQIIFSVGVLFILLAAVLVTMNGLTISVLERIAEIGTMRAIGARRSLVSKLFFVEVALLVFSSVVVGIILGIICCGIVSAAEIELVSPLLRSIFGGKYLRPIISLKLVLLHFVFAFFISAFSWLGPVRFAFKISPAQVMGRKM